MPLDRALDFATAVIDSIEADDLSDDTLSKLCAIVPEKMIVAALDIIDRTNVVHFFTPWGHSEYQVVGSTGNYTVFLDLRNAKVPHSCTCPAFLSSVLMQGTHIMCKHILATMIARRMKLCTDRPCNADDLVSIYAQQFTIVEKVVENND